MALHNGGMRNKSSFHLGGNFLLVALLVLSVALVTVYCREGSSGPLHYAQALVSGITSPFKAVGGAVQSAEDSVADSISDSSADADTLTELKEQNAELIAQLANLNELEAENERLQALVDEQKTYDLNVITGQVIGRNTDAWNQVITVGLGSDDGIELGAAVMGSSGLVGQVIAVSPFSCDVRLLTDPSSGVAVIDQTTRDDGIVSGSLEGLLYLEDMDASSVVQQGDILVTSGLGGVFPKGIAVGVVANVQSSEGTSDRTIVVSGLASADPLEEVSIVVSDEVAASRAASTDTTADSSSATDADSSAQTEEASDAQ